MSGVAELVRPAAMPLQPLRLAVRATLFGGVVSALLLIAVELSGLLPAELRAHRCGGVALAWLAGSLGNLVLAQALADRSAQSGARFLRAMVVDFMLLLLLGGGASLALFLVGAKFLAGATFALAFAASAIVIRITGAGVMSTALSSAARRPVSERRT